MNKKVRDLLNDQINKEMYSSYLYMAFSFYFGKKGLDGFANWYMVQQREEFEHASKMINYMHDNGEEVELLPIAKPDKELNDDLQVLKEGLAHEQYVTSLIDKIYEAAVEAKEYRTMEFLNYFVKEQVEEEVNANDLIAKYEMCMKDNSGLYELNKELKKRQ